MGGRGGATLAALEAKVQLWPRVWQWRCGSGCAGGRGGAAPAAQEAEAKRQAEAQRQAEAKKQAVAQRQGNAGWLLTGTAKDARS